nr:endo alpha-1,4 polygalactosaminidase [Deltaproteobacteria bacterium]
DMDFAVNEECFEYAECDALAPFIAANKPVWNTEYTDGDLATKGATVCPGAIALDFDTLIKHLDLGAERHTCR